MKTQSNFIVRTATGFIFVAVILASMLSLESFAILCYILSILTSNEYAKLLKKQGIVISDRKTGLSTLPVIAVFVVCYTQNFDWLWIFVSVFMLGLLATFSMELFHKRTNQMQNVAYSFFSYFYITLPFACLIYVYSKSPLFALALFAFVWMHDTFSYLVGIKFGKNKLFERVSPKKTWEGFFGGLIATIIAGFAFGYFIADDIARIMDPYVIFKWVGMAIVVVIAGTFGDLFESLFKRSIEVKDSGTLLPGHGGLLDRLDSILFVAPAITVYLMLVDW
ncbi:MAG: phosphatidate cytidylyltransferase [Bacteroidales bacterium]|jgi:phosphatidate cytidylyltransferase|nr:phosphatidate cytidylyltransferase [Bacteroidales bacterium]